MQTSILFLIFAAVVFSCVYFTQRKFNKKIIYGYEPVVKTDLNPDEVELLRLINQHRIAIGLNELIPELLASQVCLDQNLKDIVNRVSATHNGWAQRIIDCKCDGNDGSEILGNGFMTALPLFNAYMNSPKHKQAIEGENRTHIGISFIQKRNYCLILNHK